MFRVRRVPITFVPLVASCGVYCFGALVSFLSGQALFHNFDDLKLWRRWMAVMLLENTFVVHDEEFHLFKVSVFFGFPYHILLRRMQSGQHGAEVGRFAALLMGGHGVTVNCRHGA